MTANKASRRLLYRSYVFVAGSLVLVAVILDFGFRQLHTDTLTPKLAEAAMQLVEHRLQPIGADEHPAIIESLQQRLDLPIRLLPADHVIGDSDKHAQIIELSDSQGQLNYLRFSESLNANIQIGPIVESKHALTDWLPRLFYLAVFAIVGAWLWPLMKDLNVISRAARVFAADYRQPIETRDRVSTLNELASNLDDMAARIHSLIRSQKELAGALSHEIRTPLARIKFALAVIQKKQGSIAEFNSVDEDVQEIDTLIATLLDYARLDHPGTELAVELTPTTSWLAICAQKFEGMGVKLIVENRLTQYRIGMDPQLMALAVSNLLMNAARYAHTQVQITLELDHGMIALHIDDDGPGIDPANRKSVFEPFARPDNSRSKHTGGHGLGLAIVARIAALHGGTVEASQNPKGGARLSVRWPGELDKDTLTAADQVSRT